jgi:hypothetical protein
VETTDERIVEKNRNSAVIIAEVFTACSRRASGASHWTGWSVQLLHENFRLYNSLPNSKFCSTNGVYMGSLFDLFGCCSAAGYDIALSCFWLAYMAHTCMYVQHHLGTVTTLHSSASHQNLFDFSHSASSYHHLKHSNF